ncbi:MAG TPA: hypothetical protein VEQ58_07100 [Polyangiaceae bacterium]|nr:hypothetical protein [Polyangiaceae bacterium]
MPAVAENDFIEVSLDGSRRLVWLKRSARRPSSVAEITAAFSQANQAMTKLDRSRLRLLIDLRLSPGNNDPEFENAMALPRAALMSGFQAVAVLVQTAIGALQVSRIGREDGMQPPVFTDEKQALAWLTAR